MPGLGAPQGNQYAKKEKPGKTLGVYLTGDDFQTIKAMCEQQGVAATEKLINSIARGLLKDAIQREKRKLRKAPKREAEGDAA